MSDPHELEPSDPGFFRREVVTELTPPMRTEASGRAADGADEPPFFYLDE